LQKDSPLIEVRDGDEFNYELAIQGYGVRTNNGLPVRVIGRCGNKVCGVGKTIVALVRLVGGENIVTYDDEGYPLYHGLKGFSDTNLSLVMNGTCGKKKPIDIGLAANYDLSARSHKAVCLMCNDVIGPKKFAAAFIDTLDGDTVTDYSVRLLYQDGKVDSSPEDSYDVPGLDETYEGISMEKNCVGDDMEKKDMVPFSIYAFRDGCKVVDEDGSEVEVLCTDRENNGEINIIGVNCRGRYLECDVTGRSTVQHGRQVLFMDMDCYLSWLEEHWGLKRFDLDMAMEGHGLKTLKGDSARIIKVWKEEKKLTVLVNTKASHEDIREYDFEGRWLEDKDSVMEMLLVEVNKVV